MEKKGNLSREWLMGDCDVSDVARRWHLRWRFTLAPLNLGSIYDVRRDWGRQH